MSSKRKTSINWLLVAVHVGGWAPLAWVVYRLVTDPLVINPIHDFTVGTGLPALVLLVLTLAVTPANTLLGWRWAIPLRKWFGLYAFFYVCLHFLTFVGVDYGFDLNLIYGAIFEKRFALVGFAAFLLLIPLALTSTRGWQRRLGKAWKRLHRLVYVVAVLAVIHFVWLVKSDYREPLLYGAAIALLLIARVPAVRQRLSAWRARLGKSRPSTARPEPAGERPPSAASEQPSP
jgi:sulfoxide reductase heme-binding subunit YedZ